MVQGVPYQEDPWQGIVNVQWPAGFGVLQIDFPNTIALTFDPIAVTIGPHNPTSAIPNSEITAENSLYRVSRASDPVIQELFHETVETYFYHIAGFVDYGTASPPPNLEDLKNEVRASRETLSAADPDFFTKGEIECTDTQLQFPYTSPPGSDPNQMETFVSPSCGGIAEPDRTIFYTYWVGHTTTERNINKVRKFYIVNFKELGSGNKVTITGPGTSAYDTDIGESNIAANLRLFSPAANFSMQASQISATVTASYNVSRNKSYYAEGVLFSLNRSGFL